jgi:uncharacterized membrane protein
MINTGRSFDRLVNFTDAIVAVAITVLVLSIVDIRPGEAQESVWQLINEYAGELITFGFTFVVVATMWRVHNRIFNGMRGYDSRIFWLNLVWLIGIVFLPWPSALYGEGNGIASTPGDGSGDIAGAGMLYWLTLALISFSGGLIGLHLRSHPELLEPDAVDSPQHSPLRGFVFSAAFIVIGVITLVPSVISSWAPFLLIPVGIIVRRYESSRAQTH